MIGLLFPTLARLGWSGLMRAIGVKAADVAGGSGAWALGLAGLVVGGLVLWHWVSPPARTYTRAEIEAAAYKRDNEMLRRAIGTALATNQARSAEMAEIKKTVDSLTSNLETERGKTQDPDAVVIRADDPWLLAKQRAAAGNRTGR